MERLVCFDVTFSVFAKLVVVTHVKWCNVFEVAPVTEEGIGGPASVAATPTRNRLRAIVGAGSEPSRTEPVPYADFGLGADSSRLRVPNIPLDQKHWIAWE